MLKKILPVLLLGSFMTGNAVFAMPKVTDLLVKIEEQTGLKTDSTCKIESTQQKVGEGVRTTEMIYYRRDSDDAFLIVMMAPEVDKGNGYLKQGDNMWMYRRNTRSFQHIGRDENIGGTGAQAEDFENKKLTDLYKPVIKGGKEVLTETKLGDKAVYQFELTAKTEDVSYPKVIYWIEKESCLPLKIQSYSLNGTLMESAYILKYTPIQGKYLFTKMIIVDEFDKGNKTVVELKNVSLKKIDDKVFTKAYLENLSK